jgi:hypothetical protein
MLGAAVREELSSNDDGCEVEIRALEALGMPLASAAYAEWLKKHGLRMLPPRRGVVCFIAAHVLPPDLQLASQAAPDRGRSDGERVVQGRSTSPIGAISGELDHPTTGQSTEQGWP